MSKDHPSKLVRGLAGFALLFGLMTVASGGKALFGGIQEQANAGAYVPFVLWFNFLAGFVYVITGIGLWQGYAWALRFAWAIAGTTALVFAAFAVHVLQGGSFEMRTLAAMTLRLLVWVGIAWTVQKKTARQ